MLYTLSYERMHLNRPRHRVGILRERQRHEALPLTAEHRLSYAAAYVVPDAGICPSRPVTSSLAPTVEVLVGDEPGC